MLSASDRYVQIGNLEKAEDFAKQFVERRATLPDGYNRLGEIAAAKGDYKTARAHYEKGLQMTYPNVQASRGLAKVNAELERNPELINYETPVIEVDAEKMEEEEDYVPSSFIGEAVEAESELPENAEEDNVDIDHFGDSVPMGEALLDDENNFWEEFDDDPDREPVPMADEENAEEEDSLIDKDMLDSFGDSSLSLAESLAEDEENPFDFSEFDDANQGEEIENAPVTEP